MATEPEVRFFLSERDAQSLLVPLGSSGKIKYTCVALSASYIALGANTGGVYCFHRDHRYIQLLANKEGAVSLVRFSPDEQFLAVVAGGGTLVIWELRLSDGGVCKRLHVSGLLREGVIKDAVWEGRRGRVYFGDSQGRVAVAGLPKSSVSSNLFRRANEIIFHDKSPIVQLDLHGDMLLVSTHLRAVLLPLSSSSRAGLQVGKKARDGVFGACLDIREERMAVYSARPGGRLWEAGAEGDVQSTVKLRELFVSSHTPILGHGCDPIFPSSSLPPSPPPALPLSYLHSPHTGCHLVSCDDDGLYLWRPMSWQLIAWTADVRGVVSVACEGVRCEEGEKGEDGDGGITVCLLVEGGRKVLVVTMATLSRCIQYLLQQKLLDQVTKLVCAHMTRTVALLHSHPPLHLTLTQHTLTCPSHQLQELQSLLDQVSREREEERVHSPQPSQPHSLDCEEGREEPKEEEREEEGEEEREREGEREGEAVMENEGTPEVSAVSQNVDDAVDDQLVCHVTVCHVTRPSGSHDDSDVMTGSRPIRRHRRSNSWSGVFETAMSAGGDGLLQCDDLWSGSHTPSHTPSSLSRELSQDILSPATPTTSSEESPWQQTMSMLEGDGPPGAEGDGPPGAGGDGPPGAEGDGPHRKPQVLRSQSLQLSALPPISMATILDRDSDDVIAVPIRSSAVSSESGSKSRSKKRSRRSKRGSSSSLPPSLPPSLPSTQSGDAREHSLRLIPETGILPFPYAGLPEAIPVSVSCDRPKPDPLPSQRSSGFVSKMKELAKQGGQRLEADTLQEAIHQPVRKVKELLSSLATPSPTASALQPQAMFINEGYVIPQPLLAEDVLCTSDVDQSDGGMVSHDTPTAPPLPVKGGSSLASATADTLTSLTLPEVFCSGHALRTLVGNWMVVMETNMPAGLQPEGEGTITDLLTLALEVGVYGSEGDLVPFLSRYASLLNGPRTMAVLGMEVWAVRCEGWRVLGRSEGGSENAGNPTDIVKKLTNQNARATDLPTYLTRMVTFDPSSLVEVCVESWPSVQPWQVAVVCSVGESDCNVESHDRGQPSLDVYATYLTRLLGNSEGVREEVGCDEELLLASLEMVLRVSPPLHQLAADDGQPRPWSHTVSWTHSSLLASLVDLCITMTTQNLRQAMLLCERHRYWLGVIQLAVAMGDKGKSLQVLLSLRDASLLKKPQKWGDLLTSVSDWQEALHIMNDLTGHVTSHVTGHVTCEGELTMSELVYRLVVSVGPALATHIITSVGRVEGGATGEEGVELHSLMVQLAAIHSEQRSVAHSLLVKIDRYLWSRQPVALSPQLQVLEEREREGRRRGEGLEQGLIQGDLEWRPTLEDSGRHWGVRVRGSGVCGVCLSPLSTAMSPQQPGVLVFHCGHTYHRHCVPELSCRDCFKRNFAEHCSVYSHIH